MSHHKPISWSHIAATVAAPSGYSLRQMSAEVVLSYATLKHPWSQALLEKAGYQLVGLVPAHDRDMVEPGIVKRVWEALYVKILVGKEEMLEPSPEALRPNTDRLFRLIKQP